MKRSKICLLACVCLLFTGCSSTSSLNDEQTNQVAEYIGGSLLKYCSSYDKVLVDTTAETAEPEASAPAGDDTETVQSETPQSSSATVTKTEVTDKADAVASVIGCDGFDFSVTGSKFYDTYPKDGVDESFALTASSGKKLLILNVSIKNTSSKKQKLNTTQQIFECEVNGDNISGEALLTLLEKDIHFLNKTVESGKSVKALLVFEVDKDSTLSNATVSVTSKSGTATLYEK